MSSRLTTEAQQDLRGKTVQHQARAHTKGLRHPQECRDRWHAIPPLDVRHERRVQASRLSELLLGHTFLNSNLPDSLPEGFRDLKISGSFARRHGSASHPTPAALPIV